MDTLYQLISSGELTKQIIWIIVSIVVGVIITLLANNKMTQANEKIRLKAKLAEKRIDVVIELLDITLQWQEIMPFSDKEYSKLGFDFENKKKSSIVYGAKIICSSDDEYNELESKFREGFEKNRYMLNNRINREYDYVQRYLRALTDARDTMYHKDHWKLSVVVKDDLKFLSDNLAKELQKYLNSNIFNYNRKIVEDMSMKEKEINKRIEFANLYKYWEKLPISTE